MYGSAESSWMEEIICIYKFEYIYYHCKIQPVESFPDHDGISTFMWQGSGEGGGRL